MSFEPGELLSLLYDAALDPALWSPALNRLADEVGGHGNVLTRINIWNGSGTSLSNRRDPVVMRQYFDHWSARNPLHEVLSPEHYAQTWRPKILVDEELVAKDSLEHTGFYNDWMAPNQMHSVMMMRLTLDGGDLSVVNISRPKHKGRYDPDNLAKAAFYHPHVMRAFTLSKRLAEASEASREFDAALDQLSHSIFLLDADGRVRHLNRAAQHLLGESRALVVKSGRLHAENSPLDRRLAALVQSAAAQDGGDERGGTLTLPSLHQAEALSITVAPLSSPRLSIFSLARAVLVCVTRPAKAADASEAGLRQAFGLTLAEARLAGALSKGQSLADIAGETGRSLNTVRAQLSSIFSKLGVHRQVDLVRTVSSFMDNQLPPGRRR